MVATRSEPSGADDLTAVQLMSRRLALEPLRLEDADELVLLLNDASLHHYIGGTPPTRDQLRARIERQVRGRSPDGHEYWLNWLVRKRPRGPLVGTMQATVHPERTSRVAVLAWTIGSAHQGQGLATEAADLMVSWLRQQGITCLRAHIHPRHDASMAVAAAIGLKPTNRMVNGERRWESARAPGC
jgi:RimJ/RimL family protein N-acetyltransferase